MKAKPWIFLVFILLFAVSFLAAKSLVIINGGKANVRTVMVENVPYVAAPDIAKAMGLPFRISSGVLVFGMAGGAEAKSGETVEFGKWGFNGKVRIRAIKAWQASTQSWGNPYRVTLEFANAMEKPLELHFVVCRWYKEGSLVETTLGDQPNEAYNAHIPKGGHRLVTYELQSEPNLVNIDFNPSDWDMHSPYVDYMQSPMLKLKLKETSKEVETP